MSKQENKFSWRKMLRLTAGLVLRRRVLAGIAAIVMGASLVFTWSVSAHNIDLAKAREVARDYARSVRDTPGLGYLHYTTNCVRAFPGHNHFVRCVIEYQNAKDTAAGVYTCKESIELFMSAHGSSGQVLLYDIYGRHTSQRCGRLTLEGGRMS